MRVAGFTVTRYAVDCSKRHGRLKLFLLHCGSARVEHFWAASA
jgi:hypothetical protein